MLRILKARSDSIRDFDGAQRPKQLREKERTPIVSHVPVNPASLVSDAPSLSSLSSNNSTSSFQSPVVSLVYGRCDDDIKPSLPSKRGLVSVISATRIDEQAPKRPRIEAAPATRKSQDNIVLLAAAADSAVLSPLHIFVREQIEVFQATDDDMKQPAPGRRIPIQPLQVGLRCIHCKNLKARERKKRAICYPSSVGRIYNSVSDMKFSHWPCPEMPSKLQQMFLELKEACLAQGRSTKDSSSCKKNGCASIAQYYHDSARDLGLVDGTGGIYSQKHLTIMESQDCLSEGQQESSKSSACSPANELKDHQQDTVGSPSIEQGYVAASIRQPGTLEATALGEGNTQDLSTKHVNAVVGHLEDCGKEKNFPHHIPEIGTPSSLLAVAADSKFLAPIHCFARRNIEVFTATEEDMSAPAPGRKKPIVLGQVGLRCLHCKFLPKNERVKRSVCYPPSVACIYHAISNMKYEHFKLCKGMSKALREEYQQAFASASSSSSLSSGYNRPGVSYSTAQYYQDSALRIGLVDDTKKGVVRFCQGRVAPQSTHRIFTKNAVDLDGIEALVIAATDSEVRAKHEQRSFRASAL